MSPSERPLGRREPSDDRHLRRYSLTAATLPTTPVPVCIGIPWYRAFDDPVQHGRDWWLPGPAADWGRLRGGHEVCLKPPSLTDTPGWWRFYDQGQEGACVGFALSRMMSLLNRRRYDALRLYHEAQLVDEFRDTPPAEGTSGRAGCDVLRERGAWRWVHGAGSGPFAADGISANRWATSIEDIAACLSPDDMGAGIVHDGYVTLLNSWGADVQTGYPHLTRMPLETLNRLVFREGGDAVTVTDK